VAKTFKFDDATSWPVFWHQFQTIVKHNCWTCLKKSTYLQGRATNMLHGVLKGITCEETLKALEDCFRDQHLATAYRSHLKARTQGVRESLQEFAIDVEQLAQHAYPALPEDHIRREAGNTFADQVREPGIRIQLLLRGEETVNKALRQALELQAELLAARPPEKSARIF
jgi:hypothetical protein